MSGEPLPYHPLANLFPLIEGRDFDELVSDVKAVGLREPITLFGGRILDGRNRYRACQSAGVQAPSVEFGGDENAALRFVISKNLRRRHLKDSQRALIAARLASRRTGENGAKYSDTITQGEAAQLLNVRLRSLGHARVVVAGAVPALLSLVERGTLSVSAAARVAHLSSDAQIEVAGKGASAVVAEARRRRRVHGRPGRNEYAALWDRVDEIADALEGRDLHKAHAAASHLIAEIQRVASDRRGSQ